MMGEILMFLPVWQLLMILACSLSSFFACLLISPRPRSFSSSSPPSSTRSSSGSTWCSMPSLTASASATSTSSKPAAARMGEEGGRGGSQSPVAGGGGGGGNNAGQNNSEGNNGGPMANALMIVDKKVRNLEKRKVRNEKFGAVFCSETFDLRMSSSLLKTLILFDKLINDNDHYSLVRPDHY